MSQSHAESPRGAACWAEQLRPWLCGHQDTSVAPGGRLGGTSGDGNHAGRCHALRWHLRCSRPTRRTRLAGSASTTRPTATTPRAASSQAGSASGRSGGDAAFSDLPDLLGPLRPGVISLLLMMTRPQEIVPVPLAFHMRTTFEPEDKHRGLTGRQEAARAPWPALRREGLRVLLLAATRSLRGKHRCPLQPGRGKGS